MINRLQPSQPQYLQLRSRHCRSRTVAESVMRPRVMHMQATAYRHALALVFVIGFTIGIALSVLVFPLFAR